MPYDGKIRISTALDNKGITDGLKSLKGEAGKLAAKAGTAIAAGLGIKQMIKMGSEFESQMSTVGAISLATSEDMEKLGAKAKQMGIDTAFSATEAGKAFEYMAMAGWKTEQMIGGIDGIMNLAAASGEDLGLVSDIVTDAMTAFGMSAEQSGHFADVLAAAASNANTNVGMMGDTFKYVAPVAGAMKFSVEDTAVAIGLMANAGIKASQAGTALRQIFARLAKPPKEAAEAMSALNLTVTNADGSFKTLSDIISEMRDKFSSLTDEQKTMYAAMLGGQEAMSGLLAIVNASEGDINKLSLAIDKADGSAKKMAETKLDNLKGQLTLLGSSAEGVGISVYEGVEEPLKNAVKVGIKSLNELSGEIKGGDLKDAVSNIGSLFGKLIKLLTQITSSVLPPLIKLLGFLGNNLEWILPLVIGIFGAMKSYTIVLTATKAIGKFNTAITAAKVASSALGAKIAKIAASQLSAAAATAATNAVIDVAGKKIGLFGTIVGLLTRKINLATAVQLAWNTVQNANPIGLTIALCAGAAAVIAAVTIAVNKETEAQKALNAANEENLEKTNERIKAYDDLKERQKESVNASLAENEHIKMLAGSLMTLADEDGNVTDANKARAEFILSELNNALGTEYKLTGNQIQNYKDLQNEIYKTIEAKKLEILLTAQEEKYAEAVKNSAAAEEAKAQAIVNGAYVIDGKLAELEQKKQDIEAQMKEAYAAGKADTAQALSDKFAAAQQQYNEIYNANAKAIEAYHKADAEIKAYAHDMEVYSEAATMAMAGQTEAAIKYLQQENSSYMDAAALKQKYADDSAKIIESLGQTYIQDLENYNMALEAYNKNSSQYNLSNVENALKRLKESAAEFEKAGGDCARGFVNGVGDTISFQPFYDKIKAQENEFKANGEYVTLGVAEGIKNGDINCINAAVEVIKDSLKAMKDYSEIKSPSRLFKREVGKYIPSGVAEGITENSDCVEYAAVDMIDKSVDKAAARIIDSKYKLSDAAQQAFDDLDLQLDFGFISEKEYYDKIGSLRDKYIKKGTKEWWEYTKKIRDYKVDSYEKAIEEYEEADDRYYNLKKKLTTLSANDEAYILNQKARRYKKYADDVLKLDGITEEKREELRKKYLKQAESSYLDSYKTIYDSIKKQFDDLVGEVNDSIDDIKKKSESLTKSLENNAPFLQKVTFKGVLKDGGDEVGYLLGDFDAYNEKLLEYNTLVEQLKSKISSKEIFNMLAEMGLDGVQQMKYLNSLPADELDKAVKSLETYRKNAKGISEGVFDDQISDLEAVKDNLDTAFNESVSNMQEELREFFGDIPDNFFDIGQKSGKSFTDAFKTEFENILNTVKTKFLNSINSFIPKFVFDTNGAYFAGGGNTYNSTVYLRPSSGESTREQLTAVKNAQTYEKMRGGY